MDDFAQLVEAESRGLIAAVTTIVGDSHRAEEIVQETFIRCYLRWWRVSRLDRPGAWARRVAVNQAISETRHRAVEVRALARLATESVDLPTSVDDHEVWSAVRALPTDQATAIALRYAADLGIDDIADAMDATPAAVRSLLHRGRTALRGSARLETYRT